MPIHTDFEAELAYAHFSSSTLKISAKFVIIIYYHAMWYGGQI